MRYLGSISLMLVCLCFMVSAAHAEEISVQPKVSKYNTAVLFNKDKNYERQELIVRFAANVSPDERKAILQQVNGCEVSFLKEGNFAFARVQAGVNLQDAANQLLKNKQVVYAEPNYQLKRNLIPQDPGYFKQWYLSKIGLPKAWEQTKGSAAITVAVIDDGVQQNQPELAGRIVSPYNAVTGVRSYTPHDHATHVAGVIAAAMNSTGITGIAPNVKIMPINVFDGDEANADVVAKAIKYAVAHHADVINMSLGSPDYSYLMDYYAKYARSKGVVLVAAAGNSHTTIPMYPAALQSVIGVSATDRNDHSTYFSSYGRDVDVAAPGEDIYSITKGNGFAYMSGTSMAAPIVSGVVALIRSKNPLLSADQVEVILEKSTRDLGQRGWDPYYGYGRVDAYKAVANTPKMLLKVSSPSAFSMTGTNKATVSVTASGGKNLSVYIKNSSGKLLKYLIKNQTRKTSIVKTAWNGKLDSGKFVSSGSYKVTLKVTNGQDNYYKTVTMRVINNTVPSISTTGTAFYFSPAVHKSVAVPFRLNKSAKVTAAVYTSAGRKVRTLLNQKSLPSGNHTITWNGHSSTGTHMQNGTYKLLMSVIDSRKVKGHSRSLQIKIDTVKPTAQISLPATLFKMDSQNKYSAGLKLKETSTINVYIENEQGKKVKKIINQRTYKAGSVALSWNGRDDNSQFMNEGKYRYYAEVKDLAGNSTTVNSSLFSLQDWRPPTIKSAGDIYVTTRGPLTIGYTLTKPANVSIDIYNGENLIKTIQRETPQAAGGILFVWDETDQTGTPIADGTYQFVIQASDKYHVSRTFTGQIHVQFNAAN